MVALRKPVPATRKAWSASPPIPISRSAPPGGTPPATLMLPFLVHSASGSGPSSPPAPHVTPRALPTTPLPNPQLRRRQPPPLPHPQPASAPSAPRCRVAAERAATRCAEALPPYTILCPPTAAERSVEPRQLDPAFERGPRDATRVRGRPATRYSVPTRGLCPHPEHATHPVGAPTQQPTRPETMVSRPDWWGGIDRVEV